MKFTFYGKFYFFIDTIPWGSDNVNVRTAATRYGINRKEAEKKMNAKEKANGFDHRLLSITELTHYTGLGRTKAREWAKEIGAVRKIGTRVLYDKHVIDATLDGQEGR